MVPGIRYRTEAVGRKGVAGRREVAGRTAPEIRNRRGAAGRTAARSDRSRRAPLRLGHRGVGRRDPGCGGVSVPALVIVSADGTSAKPYLGRRRVGRGRVPLGAPRGLLDVVPPVLVRVPLRMPAGRHRRGRPVRGRRALRWRRPAAVVGVLAGRTALGVPAALAGIASGLICWGRILDQ